MIGTVERYDRVLAYGFITGEDGRSYFVHRSEILGPSAPGRGLGSLRCRVIDEGMARDADPANRRRRVNPQALSVKPAEVLDPGGRTRARAPSPPGGPRDRG